MLKFGRRKKIKGSSRNLVTLLDPKSSISEHYRTIRTNIQFSSVDKKLKTIMLTSAGPGEGKSTTTANLAVVFAQQGKKVLLVDADLRKPTVHHTFGYSNLTGFTSYLSKQCTMEEALLESEENNLYIMTSGPIPPNPAELLSSNSMKRFLKEGRKRFDYIFFDSPPIIPVTDSQIIATFCDGAVLVVSSGKTEIEQVKKAKELLIQSKSKLLGVVLNNKEVKTNDYYYYYKSN